MLLNLNDYHLAAAEGLPRAVYDYFAGGAWDEITLAENRAAFDRIQIQYRVLRGVADRDTSTTALGVPISMPVLVAPMALQRLAHPDGEVATARGTHAAGTIMGVSTMANTSLEDVSQASPGEKWFQVYVYRDRGITEALVARAEAAGYGALVLTVDTPMVGMRERDVRNSFGMSPDLTFANFVSYGLSEMGAQGSGEGSHLAHYSDAQFDPGLTWDDVAWLGGITSLPVLVKGVVHPEDAVLAVEAGVAGIVVSNHGARQLDTSPATIEVLPEVVAAVQGRVEVYVDGGIQRGTDVLKAVALGAQAVLLGRPVLWGLAVAGAAGVERVLGLLLTELDMAMALSGFRTIADVRTLGPGSIRRSDGSTRA